MTLSLRSWATPLTVGSFLVMGATGTLMFFHMAPGLAKGVHEWAGLVMVAGAAAHLAINWRPFLSYLKRPLAQGIMGAGALVLAAAFLPLGGGEDGPPGLRGAMEAMGKAPLPLVAQLAGKTPEELAAILKEKGALEGQTLAEASGGDMRRRMELMSAVFAAKP